MAARHHAEAAVAWGAIAEVKLAIDQAAAHAPIVIGVKARAVEVDLAVAVQVESFGAPRGGEDIGRVVEFPAPSEARY